METVIAISALLFAAAVLAGLANISNELKDIRDTLRERNKWEVNFVESLAKAAEEWNKNESK